MEALKLSELYCSEKEGNDESGTGTKESPVKTILQAMKIAGKEPFPSIFVDAKTEGKVEGWMNDCRLREVWLGFWNLVGVYG